LFKCPINLQPNALPLKKNKTIPLKTTTKRTGSIFAISSAITSTNYQGYSMKLFNITVASLLFAASSVLNIANAGLITLDQKSTSVNGGIISYVDLVAESNTVSDATFTLNIAGDFDAGYENVAISVEGYSLGVVFDRNTNNDLFDFSGDDYVGDHGNFITMTGVATIAQADWANIIADGFVSIEFNLSGDVNCCSNPHAFTSGNISYDVPEPATLAIFALALIGFGARRLKQ